MEALKARLIEIISTREEIPRAPGKQLETSGGFFKLRNRRRKRERVRRKKRCRDAPCLSGGIPCKFPRASVQTTVRLAGKNPSPTSRRVSRDITVPAYFPRALARLRRFLWHLIRRPFHSFSFLSDRRPMKRLSSVAFAMPRSSVPFCSANRAKTTNFVPARSF